MTSNEQNRGSDSVGLLSPEPKETALSSAQRFLHGLRLYGVVGRAGEINHSNEEETSGRGGAAARHTHRTASCFPHENKLRGEHTDVT